MTIHLSSTITDNEACNNTKKCSDDELKQKFQELFAKENHKNCSIHWLEDNTVEIQGATPMSLHSFTLQAEAMGKQVKYHKQTIIEIV